ncbi:alpha/beta fold hydrolase [Falsiroseomonas selenitidurans]|uniref:Alpha/beta fold hydrolase n=1 Tax=Falsiroseomonas selenitidurans TaxID=2716335 RepID=A0ABX1DX66_9PROT|nr:alpha/beta fold hydrolase [Falsiroseomonas selenitidurans]NKC29471.1 alpha/beta fold hydrolase [Falsiroseomonas selenitidurans]
MTETPQAGPATPPPREAILPGVRLCYRDSGGTGAPIVLLHANTGTSASWDPQFAAFAAAGHRVLAFDRRGWGASLADPATGPQPASVAQDLDALAGHLDLPRFHLLGVAGGGFCALDYAAWRQDRLLSLTIAASNGSFAEPEMQQLSANIQFEGFRALPESFREIGPSFRALYPDRVRAWEHAQEQARQKDTPNQPPLRTPNTFAKVAAIRLPVLAITASADLYAPPVLMARWLRHLPQAQLVAIADAGHSVPMEQPEAFNDAVLGFIGRL